MAAILVVNDNGSLAAASQTRTVADATTNTDTSLVSATIVFVASDVGKAVTGAGIAANTWIASRTNATTAVLNQATLASANNVTIVVGTAATITAAFNGTAVVNPVTSTPNFPSVGGMQQVVDAITIGATGKTSALFATANFSATQA